MPRPNKQPPRLKVRDRGVAPDRLKALTRILGNQRDRIDHLYKIVDERGESIDFHLNKAQKLLFFNLWFCNVILKSRQHGITTFFCIFYLDICLFNPNMSACIVCHNKEDAEKIFRRYIRHPYESLPVEVRAMVPTTTENKRELIFSNGSSISVITSGRSGTYQLVHISELGKISAKFPDKAQEIKTGTLNAVHPGQIVSIESTAEGRQGLFWEMVALAQKQTAKAKGEKRKHHEMEWKFHFFGWTKNALNESDPESVVITDRMSDYFKKVEQKINEPLTPRQKAWYVMKEQVQGFDMKREHPSTPDEAFEVSIDGAFFSKQIIEAYSEGRITDKLVLLPNIMVDTWWDIGFHDSTAIWLTQDVGREIHVVGYYENNNEGFEHYMNWLVDHATSRKFLYGRHTGPFDIAHNEYMAGKTRIETAARMGLRFQVAPKMKHETQIEAVRQILKICWFDESACSLGLKRLESFRKKWNDRLGTWADGYLHDENSDGAKAFCTLAVAHSFQGNYRGMMSADVMNIPEHILAKDRRRAEIWKQGAV